MLPQASHLSPRFLELRGAFVVQVSLQMVEQGEKLQSLELKWAESLLVSSSRMF